MGTGKSTIGRLLAEHLQRPFIDTDEEIEREAGAAITDIFSSAGEAGFRRMESQVFTKLLDGEPAVIATGGGTLLDVVNRDRARRQGVVVCLLADSEEIFKRVGGGLAASKRPLLAPDIEGIRARLAERSAAYAAASHVAVDTTGLEPSTVVDQILLAVSRHEQNQRSQIPIPSAAGEYTVEVGFGLLQEAGLRTAPLVSGRRAVIVTDDGVGPYYLETVARSYRNAGFQVTTAVVPAGEETKSLRWVEYLHDVAIDAGLDRRCCFVALGGGVVGDLAGFAAATFMRGVPIIQIPTTLLAQIDASVGGKTAVNHPRGKNLIGSFHPPVLVVCDLDVLDTLPDREWKSGMAEAIKHGIMMDAAYFDWIQANLPALSGRNRDHRLPLVVRSIEIKGQVVAEDERESGWRAVLNLGHTIGHAIETCLNYRHWLHGEAVSVGLVAAARIAMRLGKLNARDVERIEQVLAGVGLPTRLPPQISPADVLAATRTDKKRMNDRQRWVLPVAIGQVVITEDVPPEIVAEVLDTIS